MPYEIRFTREAKKDIDKLTPKLKQKLKALVQDTITASVIMPVKSWSAILLVSTLFA